MYCRGCEQYLQQCGNWDCNENERQWRWPFYLQVWNRYSKLDSWLRKLYWAWKRGRKTLIERGRAQQAYLVIVRPSCRTTFNEKGCADLPFICAFCHHREQVWHDNSERVLVPVFCVFKTCERTMDKFGTTAATDAYTVLARAMSSRLSRLRPLLYYDSEQSRSSVCVWAKLFVLYMTVMTPIFAMSVTSLTWENVPGSLRLTVLQATGN